MRLKGTVSFFTDFNQTPSKESTWVTSVVSMPIHYLIHYGVDSTQPASALPTMHHHHHSTEEVVNMTTGCLTSKHNGHFSVITYLWDLSPALQLIYGCSLSFSSSYLTNHSFSVSSIQRLFSSHLDPQGFLGPSTVFSASYSHAFKHLLPNIIHSNIWLLY